MNPLVITVAGVGAELTKKDTPYLPSSPDEILQEAITVDRLGAHVFHLHARDRNGKPSINPKLVRSLVRRIRRATGLIVQISTGGAIGDSERARLRTLVPGVQMASLTLGTINFGKAVFVNRLPFIEKLAGKMRALKIKPELEIFDVSHAEVALYLLKKGLIKPPLHFNIILGGPGWLAATEENLKFILKKLPPGATWSASGVGKNQLPMITYAVKHRGHVRVGLEDNIFIKKGVLAKGNTELVEQTLVLAKKYKRPLANQAVVRRILGVCRA